jgi:hypothetical protein
MAESPMAARGAAINPHSIRYRQVNLPKLIESVDQYLQAPAIPTATRPADIISYAVWLYCARARDAWCGIPTV